MIVNPGLRRSLASAIQRMFNQAPFYAPLKNSLILEKGTGSPTFTRATTAYVQNNDGYMVTALAGEARFSGARRIYNLIPAAGSGSASLAVAANKSMTLAAGTYVFSMGAGTGTATFSGTGGATGTLAASASGRVSVSKTITAGTFIVTASVATLVDLQVEWVDPQTTKTAGEYVSVTCLDYRNDKDPLFVNLTGAAGTYVSAPSAGFTPAAGITTFVFDGALTDWSTATEQGLMSQAQAAGTQFCFDMTVINDAGNTKIRTYFSLDGVNILSGLGAAFLMVDGNRYKIATTHNAATGDVAYYSSSDDGATWTARGTASITAGTLFNSTSAIEIGSVYLGTATRSTGKAYEAQIYHGDFIASPGTATLAVDYNAHRDAVTPTGTITSSTTGEVWTNNGAATVRSAAYHGSGVDGVKYFNTDISGNPIPAATLKKYLAEGARTNVLLGTQSLDDITYWTVTGNVVTAPTRTGSQSSPDGLTKAVKLAFPQVIGVNAYSLLNTAAAKIPTMTAAVYDNSWYLKGEVGGEKVYLAGTPDGVTYLRQLVTLTTEWVRYEFSGTPTAVAWYWQIGVDLRDASQATQAAQTIYAYHPQLEIGTFASSPIPTTTIAVARNADVLTYPVAGNYSEAAGTIYAEFDPIMLSNGSYSGIVAIDNGAQANEVVLMQHATTATMFWSIDTSSVNQGYASVATTVATNNKVSLTYGAATTATPAVNGVVGAVDPSVTAPSTVTRIAIGTEALARPFFGNIGNVRIWQRQLSSTALAAITA